MDYYDRLGQPIPTAMGWAMKMEQNDRRVAATFIGRQWFPRWWVSTVWMGLNHQYGDGPPLIFETMVFEVKDGQIGMGGLDCIRTPTLQAAREAHEEVLNAYRRKGRVWGSRKAREGGR